MACLFLARSGIRIDDFLHQVGRSITRTLASDRILLSRQLHTVPKYIKITDSNGVRRITMINNETNNALSLKMMSSILYGITDDIDNPKLRSIVLTVEHGTGYFSTGLDMAELTSNRDEQYHRTVFDTCAQLMKTIENSPVPVIAAVDGLSADAGCQLVATCDIVLCTDRSSFSTPGINSGIFCSTAGIPLMRNIPRKLAAHMLITGLPITAHEAFSAGLVTKVVPIQAFEGEIKKITDSINEKSRSAIQLGKRFISEQIEATVERAYSLSTDVMVENLKLMHVQESC